MKCSPTRTWITVALVLILHGPGRARGETVLEPGPVQVRFHREVVNLENFAGLLFRQPPLALRHGPPAQGELWYGQIFRQLPGDDPASREHNVLFAVQLQESQVVRAWCDTNMNGDLADDPPEELSAYPGDRAARSFLSDLRWTAVAKGHRVPVDRLVRVVVFAPDSVGANPPYRTQDVYGMLGTVDMAGMKRLALLYDANGDGLYTKANGDGVFFDLDNDRHFTIDVMASDFGPFTLPFSIDHRDYAVASLDLEGKDLTLQSLGPSAPAIAPMVGVGAPDFSYLDVRGRPVRLSSLRGRAAVVYFWSSLCSGCRKHADELRALYERYDRSQLEILGVSYDFDRSAMERFRAEHGHTWPTSFTGGFPAQDPVGRLYQETGSGVFYVVAPDGRLAGKDFDVASLASDLERILGSPRGTLGSSR